MTTTGKSWLREQCAQLANYWLGDEHEDNALNLSADMQAIAEAFARRAVMIAIERWTYRHDVDLSDVEKDLQSIIKEAEER